MGRLTRHTSGNRTRCSLSTLGAQSIPELFKTRAHVDRGMPDNIALSQHEEKYSEDSQSASEEPVSIAVASDHPRTLSPMTAIAAAIKNTFSSAIMDLKADLLALTENMASVVRADFRRDRAIQRLDSVVETHGAHLIAITKPGRSEQQGNEAEHKGQGYSRAN